MKEMKVNPSFTIGVELEMTGLSRLSAALLIAEYFSTGVGHIEGDLDVYEIIADDGRVWRVLQDSSIEPQRKHKGKLQHASEDFQVEVVSPILYDNDIPMLQEIIRILRVYGGAMVNRSTAVHIHVGAHKFTSQNLHTLCNIIYKKQFLLEKALHFYSRERYCERLPKMFIEQLNEVHPQTFEDFADIWYAAPHPFDRGRDNYYHHTRYRLLNLHQLLSGQQKTIEFRMFNGTLDEEQLKSYIQLSTLIAAQALNQQRATFKVQDKKVRNDKYACRTWLVKMGAVGNEYKGLRSLLLSSLEGNAAWSDPNRAPNQH